MKAFVIRWTRSGLNGFFNYLVVAEDIESAKELWNEYAAADPKIAYHWEIAKHGGHRGTVAWYDQGTSVKEKGCYKLEYEQLFVGSDHLWD